MDQMPGDVDSDSTGSGTDAGDHSATDAGDHSAGTPSRRTLLRSAGAAVAIGGLAAMTGSAAAEEYGDVVNIVDDYGADPTGEEPINDALNDAVRDDTKVIFPEGEYWIGGDGFHRWEFGEGPAGEMVSNVGLVGRGDVTLRPSDGINMYIFAIWGDGVHIENFTIDQSAENTATGISSKCETDLVIRDIVIEGVADRHNLAKVGPAVTDPDGTAVVEEFHVPDGSAGFTRQTGAWVFPEHAGHLLFNRCSFQQMADNAIYASGPGGNGNGSVGIENCYFRNNNVSSIRLGTPGSYAKNCTVVIDGYIPEYDSWGAVTARAAWLWSDFDGSLKNIDVVSDHESGYGFYTYPGHDGPVTLKNCRFEMNEDGTEAIRFTDGVGDVDARNVSVTGEAGDGPTIDLAVRDANFRNLCLRQTGEDRDGIRVSNGSVTVENGLIDVTGERVVADEDSDVTLENLREDGGCPPADPSHPMEP